MVAKIRSRVMGSLRVRITLMLIVLLALLLAAYTAFNAITQRRNLEEALLAKGVSMAQSGAAAVGHILEDAIASGRLSEAQVFDTQYQPIEGTDPPKYHTAYDSFTDANFPAVQEVFLQDADVLFAAAMTRDGYVPTHNRKFAQELTGDYEKDLKGNRTKRIFDDAVAKAAGASTEPYLLQPYTLDTGVRAWNLSAPIMVNGKHWGAFRVGLSLQRIEARLAAAVGGDGGGGAGAAGGGGAGGVLCAAPTASGAADEPGCRAAGGGGRGAGGHLHGQR